MSQGGWRNALFLVRCSYLLCGAALAAPATTSLQGPVPVLPAPCPRLGEQQSLWGNLLPSPSVTVEDWEWAGLPGS